MDELGINPAAIHALWTMHGLGVLDGQNTQANKVAVKALEHASPGVRKAAVQVLPRSDWANAAILEANILNDPDPHTQLAVLLKTSEMPPNMELGSVLYEAK